MVINPLYWRYRSPPLRLPPVPAQGDALFDLAGLMRYRKCDTDEYDAGIHAIPPPAVCA